VRHFVLAALLAITAVSYAQRNCISPAETTIRDDLRLDMRQTGIAAGAFFFSYALLQVPSGWLAQRWGARLALPAFAAGWSLALGLLALASGVFGLVAARLAMGALQAGIFPCATLVLASWYPPSRRGLASALLNSFMLIGSAVGSMITGELLKPLGWRALFGLYVIPGLVWSVWFLWWFRNRPQDHPGVNAAELAVIAEDSAPPTKSPGRPARAPIPWAAILLSAPLLFLCGQQFCRAGANRFFDNWMATYVQEVHGVTEKQAGVLASLPQWAGVPGGLVGGMISDAVLRRTRSRRAARKGVAVASLSAAIACYCLAYPIADVWVATLVLSLGAFFFTFSAPCSYALTMDLGGKNVAIVFGLMNMAGNLGSFAFTSLAPSFKAWAGDNWGAVLALFVGMHVVAVLCWLPLAPEGTIGEGPPAPQDQREEKP
jgi:sugar phosphate permease